MIPTKKFIPAIIWFLLVLFLICIPGKNLPKTGDWFEKIYFDKWVHAGLFCILAFLWMLPLLKSSLAINEKKKWMIKILLGAIVWGITTELIQKYFIVGRAFDLLDWTADSVGVLVAFIFCKQKYISNSSS